MHFPSAMAGAAPHDAPVIPVAQEGKTINYRQGSYEEQIEPLNQLTVGRHL